MSLDWLNTKLINQNFSSKLCILSIVSYSKCSKFVKLCWAIFLLSYLVYQLIIQCKRMQGPKSGSISALGQSVFLIYLDIWALRNFFNFHSISSCKKVLKLQTAFGCAEFRSRLLEGEFLNPIWTKWKFHFDLSLSMLQWVLA